MRIRASLGILPALLGVLLYLGYSHPKSEAAGSWDAAKAARYLDQRAKWWMAWPPASRDH